MIGGFLLEIAMLLSDNKNTNFPEIWEVFLYIKYIFYKIFVVKRKFIIF